MEIRQYFYLVRKWAWLLILGVLIGAGVAYFLSARQPALYQASTRVMVMRAPDTQIQEYSSVWSDIQLAKTYSQLITTGPVLSALSEKLGYNVSGGQIRSTQVPDSFILDIVVRDYNPQRVAEIANSLVGVFIDYNENLLYSRFNKSEQTLQTQIDQLSRTRFQMKRSPPKSRPSRRSCPGSRSRSTA